MLVATCMKVCTVPLYTGYILSDLFYFCIRCNCIPLVVLALGGNYGFLTD